MGPTVWSTQKGETTYALRALPVGGFVSMEGDEEGENPDSRAFCNKKPWQRLIIMAAGPAMNLLLGYLIVLGLTASGNAIATPVIHSFDEDAVTSQYFEPGDRIVSMDGHRVHTANDISFYLSREDDGIMDVVVLRDGEQVSIPDVHFKMVNVQGVDMVTIDFIVVGEEKNLINVPVYALDWTISLTKQVWFSLWDLVFTDRYGVEQMSGPVGVAGAIGESGSHGPGSVCHHGGCDHHQPGCIQSPAAAGSGRRTHCLCTAGDDPAQTAGSPTLRAISIWLACWL